MADLTGQTIANTYKDLLQVSNSNSGIDGTLRLVSDGEGTDSVLQISSAGVASTGTFAVTGTSALTGNVAVATNKFTVTAASGNTLVAGTFEATGASTLTGATDVVGNFSVATNKLTVAAATGNTAVAGTLDAAGASTLAGTGEVTGNFTVNTNKFTVAASTGNTLVAGTFDSTGAATMASTCEVTGNFTVATNKLTVAAASGNTLVAGTFDATGAATMASTVESTGNFTVATNKFTVAAATGNTVVAGTLGVTGAVTLTAAMDVGTTLAVGGDITLESADTITNAAGNTIVMTASTAVEFTGGIDVQGGDITLENDEVIKNDVDGTVEVTSGVFKHAFDAAAYWTATQADAGSVTFASVSDGTPGFAFSQAVTLSSTLGVGGDITLQNTETISNAVNGTVEVTSAVFKHAVDAAAYWTATQADAGAVTFASVSDGTPSFTFSQKVLLVGDFDVGSANFTVAAASGNTATAGTLDVQGGDITLQNDETIGNSVNGTIDFSAGVLKHAVDALAYWTATQADGGAVTFDSVSDGTPGFTFSDATTFSATIIMQNAMVITGDTTDRVMVGALIGFGNDNAPADNAPAGGCVIYFDGTDIKAVNNAGTTTTLSGAWA